MTQISNLEKGAVKSLERLEDDIFEAGEKLTTEDGMLIVTSYLDLINSKINTLIQDIPRGAFDVLPGKALDALGEQVRNETLTEVNQVLITKNELQMSQAIDLILENKSDTDEYKKLVSELADIQHRLLAIVLMRGVM